MRCLLLAVVLLLTGACGSSSSTTSASWTATVRMVGRAWLQGAVPRAYARRALSAAADALQDADRAGADTARRLRAAIERDDRAGAGRLVGP